jgi:excisionase family DNA binding protein
MRALKKSRSPLPQTADEGSAGATLRGEVLHGREVAAMNKMSNSNRATRAVAIASASLPRQAQKQQQAVWLSIAKAAVRVGVSPRTVKRWIAADRLLATRLPSPGGKGHLRIRLGDLEALLARGTLR